MKVLYDHQIFVAQKFGGISRYYNELMQPGATDVVIERIDPNLIKTKPGPTNRSLLSRGIRFAARKIGFDQTPKPVEIPKEVSDILTTGNFDVFHPTNYSPYFLEYTNKPFVLTVYDMIHEIFKEVTYADATTPNKRLLCKQAAHIIAISEKTKDDLIEIFDVQPEKISVIYLASTFDSVMPKAPEQSFSFKKFILFVGQRAGYKNFYFTVLALSKILKADRDLHLLCTGVPFSKEDLAFFDECGVSDKVQSLYCKTDNELAWAYTHAELFIFPSQYEGFGFPLLEAFACNCPVISSSGGSLPEVAGDAAVYFDPKNFQQLEQAATAVLYNTSLRSELVMKGKERLAFFSWDKCRKETFEVYNKISRA